MKQLFECVSLYISLSKKIIIFIYCIMTVSFDKAEGSRAEVFHGTAKHTSGGLVKSALLMNKHGRIVSSKKHNSAKREKRLLKHGYGTKKGKFGFVRIKAKGTRKHKGRKHKGGSGIHQALGSAPVNFSGSDESAGMGYPSNDSVGIQEAAGMSGGSKLRFGGEGGRRRKSRSFLGGHYALTPAPISMTGLDESAGMGYPSNDSVGIQEAAGMSGGRRTTCCFKTKKDHCGSRKSNKKK